MMKKFWAVILLALGWCIICAFQSAGEDSSAVTSAPEEDAPVLQYEPSAVPTASPQERLLRYHVLVVASLAEAAESLDQAPLWALRMVEDAEHFAALIRDLLQEPYRGSMTEVIDTLSALRTDMQRRSRTPAAQERLRQRLAEVRQILLTTCASEKLGAGLVL